MMKNYLTEPFSKDIQAFSSVFDCGNDNLNHFLKSSLALDLNYGKTYVLLNAARNRIVDMHLPKEEDDGKTKPMYRPVDEVDI